MAASNGSEQKGAMEMVIETFWHGHGQNSWLASKSSTQTEKFRMTVMKSHACSVVCKSLWTPWTVAHQAPLSMGFPRQEYWSGLPFPPPGGGVPDPRMKPSSPASPALPLDSLPLSDQRIPDKGTPPCLFLRRASF